MAASKPARKGSSSTRRTRGGSGTFTPEERAAMRERGREARRGAKDDGEAGVRAAIRAMPPADRAMAERLHGLIREAAPDLAPRTWYGMPAYARGGKVVCFFQSAAKFKARYATLGFSDEAALDEGAMWPTAFALRALGPSEEARVRELLRKALG